MTAGPTDPPVGGADEVNRGLLLRGFAGLAGLLVVAGVLGLLLREPITALAQAFMTRWGLPGLFVGVLITDTSLVPATNEPLLLLAYGGGASAWEVFVVASSASTLAGPVGWTLGRTLSAVTNLEGWLRRRHGRMVELLERNAVRALILAALTPIPFALATWTAGALRFSFWTVCACSLFRVLKTAVYLSLIVGGWALGG